jgi:hypothetical protein
MIYENLESTFRSLAGIYKQLLASVEIAAKEAVGTPAAGPLQSLVFPLDTEEGKAAQKASDSLIVTDLRAALIFGRTEISGFESRLKPLRATFDAVGTTPGRSATLERCETLFDLLSTQLRQAREELEEGATSPEGPAVNLSRIRGTVDDLASYPILTSDSSSFGGSARPSSGGRGGSISSDVQRTVDLALRDVLGRLPKYTDATAFTAALTATFELRPEQGHTVARWRPRGFVGQTELGGSVSGAQASLYARAQDSLAAAIPILHSLTPLKPDADPQEMDAARSVVESEFRAVVAELGTAGGPRVPRVTGLFRILLKDPVIGVLGATISGGMVGYLADVFGFNAGQVNTVEEETVFSNFLLLRDYIKVTSDSWDGFASTFQGRDLGTQLVLLSNALQVVAESVDEVNAALDSVFVGGGERTVARFGITSGGTMLVSELLSWVSSFASQEAPELVQQGGRRAMGPLQSTATNLIDLVGDLISAAGSDPGLPSGMRHPRVRHPLEELQTYLRQVTGLAASVRTV